MKKPAMKIEKTVSLNSQGDAKFYTDVEKCANDYATACKNAGVKPDDVVSIFLELARTKHRKFFIF